MPTARGGRIRQAREADILRAAAAVFAAEGFAGATMQGIAAAAGLPKASLHYYFRHKQALYRAVLADLLHDWLAPADALAADRHPHDALGHYITEKMRLTAERPEASRLFASEVLRGAPEIGDLLRTELRALVEDKVRVIDGWKARGWIAPDVDATHLFFTVWAATQTYADFDAQVCAVLGVARLGPDELQRATDHVLRTVLRGCGITPPRPSSSRTRGSTPALPRGLQAWVPACAGMTEQRRARGSARRNLGKPQPGDRPGWARAHRLN